MIDTPTPADDEQSPTTRAQRLLEAVRPMYDGLTPVEALAGILTDARHLADAHELAFAAADRRAHGNYLSERGDAVGPLARVNRSGQGRQL